MSDKFEIFYDMTPIEVVQEIDYMLGNIGYTIELSGSVESEVLKCEIVRL